MNRLGFQNDMEFGNDPALFVRVLLLFAENSPKQTKKSKSVTLVTFIENLKATRTNKRLLRR